jgi:hypothetical protein
MTRQSDLVLRNGRREVQIFDNDLWFINFGQLMNPYATPGTENPPDAQSMDDVFKYFSSDLGYPFMTKPATMAGLSMSLTPPGKRFFVRVSGANLGLTGETISRRQISRRAKEFGLLQCPVDAALFTFMQTQRMVQPGGELGETLYFPRQRFHYKHEWNGGEKMWGIHRPLDYVMVAWFDANKNARPHQKWAFEVPATMFDPASIKWRHNIQAFTATQASTAKAVA